MGITSEEEFIKECTEYNIEYPKYYESRFEMMGNQGWKDLIIDIDNMIESLNNISVILLGKMHASIGW